MIPMVFMLAPPSLAASSQQPAASSQQSSHTNVAPATLLLVADGWLLRSCLAYASGVPIYTPSTALIVVDVQNDFADHNGSLSVPDGASVIPVINAEIASAQKAGAPVVYTRDWHPESTPHFAKDGGIWPVHCVAGTWGAEYHPDLVVAGSEICKGSNGEDGYSGFMMRDQGTGAEIPTELDSLLRQRHVDRLIVVGLATDYCVMSTALDGLRLGYGVTVLSQAVRAVDLRAGDGEEATRAIEAAGGTVE